MPAPSEKDKLFKDVSVIDELLALRARNEVLEAGARHWNGVYKIILDERDALRARVAKLEEAALKGRAQ